MSDQTMIERVARALCVECDGRDPDDTTGGPHPLGEQLDPGEPWWTGYVGAARVALTAMREPTEGMCSESARMHGYKASDPTEIKIAGRAFTAMIDAALAEG